MCTVKCVPKVHGRTDQGSSANQSATTVVQGGCVSHQDEHHRRNSILSTFVNLVMSVPRGLHRERTSIACVQVDICVM